MGLLIYAAKMPKVAWLVFSITDTVCGASDPLKKSVETFPHDDDVGVFSCVM